MEFLIKAAEAVGAIGLLIGLAWVIKPFWIIKKRWQGLLVIIGSFILFGVATSQPVQRPSSIPVAAWAERVRICREANALRECPLRDVDVAAAKVTIAEARRKADAKAAIKAAEAKADEAEQLARAQKREAEAKAEASSKINDPTQQQLWISATQRAVKSQMRDSGSVKFRNTTFHAYQGRVPVVCGEVNAKNGFGGHSGFQRFIASGETFGPFLEEMMSPGEFAKSWNQFCVS